MSAPPLARDHMDWWLAITCVCEMSVDYPVRMLAKRYGEEVDLSKVATRLRCKKCDRRPEKVELVDRPDRLGQGHGGGTPAQVRRLA